MLQNLLVYYRRHISCRHDAVSRDVALAFVEQLLYNTPLATEDQIMSHTEIIVF